MDIREDKLKEVLQFLNMCTDEYIIAFGNKGLLKRANKEIDKGLKMEFSQDEGRIICKDSEGAVLEIGASPEECSCSCPSKSICKHIVGAILLLREEIKGDGDDEPSEEDFRWIEDVKGEDLLTFLDKSHGDDMLFRMDHKRAYEIEKGDSIKCSLGSHRIIIPSRGGMEKVLCSCGGEGMCPHKAEGMLIYLMSRGDIKEEDLRIQLIKRTLKSLEMEDSQGLNLAKDIVDRIGRIGLARVPQSILNELEVCAIKCSKDDVPSVERLLRTIKGDLEEYFSKKASFSREVFLRRLTKTALVIGVLMSGKDPKLMLELKGEKKSRYVSIGEMRFQGMGASRWKTKSGYSGTTYYLYSEDDQKVYSYTEMAEGTQEGTYSSSDPWDMGISMESVSKGSFILDGCKVNKAGRVSSSKEIKGDFVGRSRICEISQKGLNYTNWSELREDMEGKFTFTIRDEKSTDKMVILEPHKYGDVEFDKISQRSILPLEDSSGDEILMSVPYSQEDEVLIQALESAHERDAFGKKVFGRLYKIDGEIFIYPISFYYEDGRIINLNLDGRKKSGRRR